MAMNHIRTPAVDPLHHEPRVASAPADDQAGPLSPLSPGLLADPAIPQLRLKSFATIIPGASFPTALAFHETGSYRRLKASECSRVRELKITKDSGRYFDLSETNSKKGVLAGTYDVRAGDILVELHTGSPDSGPAHHCALVTEAQPQVLTPSSFAIVRLTNDRVMPAFVAWYLRSPAGQQEMRMERQGSNSFRLPCDALGRMTVPVPDLSLQEKIVALDASHDQLLALEKQRITLLEQRRRGIDQQLLFGGSRTKREHSV